MTQNLSKKCVKMDVIISNINAKVFYFCKIVWDGVENGKKQSGRWNNVDAIFLIFSNMGEKMWENKATCVFFSQKKILRLSKQFCRISLYYFALVFFSSFWCFLRNVFAIFPQEKNIFHFFVSLQLVTSVLEGNILKNVKRHC